MIATTHHFQDMTWNFKVATMLMIMTIFINCAILGMRLTYQKPCYPTGEAEHSTKVYAPPDFSCRDTIFSYAMKDAFCVAGFQCLILMTMFIYDLVMEYRQISPSLQRLEEGRLNLKVALTKASEHERLAERRNTSQWKMEETQLREPLPSTKKNYTEENIEAIIRKNLNSEVKLRKCISFVENFQYQFMIIVDIMCFIALSPWLRFSNNDTSLSCFAFSKNLTCTQPMVKELRDHSVILNLLLLLHAFYLSCIVVSQQRDSFWEVFASSEELKQDTIQVYFSNKYLKDIEFALESLEKLSAMDEQSTVEKQSKREIIFASVKKLLKTGSGGSRKEATKHQLLCVSE